MKKLIKSDVAQFSEASSRWDVTLPEAAQFYEINALYDDNKNLADFEHSVNTDFNVLQISFGFNEYTGYVKYSWIEYVPDDYNPGSSDGTTVNVYNDGSTDNSDVLHTKSFSSNINIKVAELSSNAVFVTYSLKNEAGKIEAGVLTILDETEIKIEAERIMSNDLLPVEFNVNKDSNGVNLNINSTVQDTYEFRYKTNIF